MEFKRFYETLTEELKKYVDDFLKYTDEAGIDREKAELFIQKMIYKTALSEYEVMAN